MRDEPKETVEVGLSDLLRLGSQLAEVRATVVEARIHLAHRVVTENQDGLSQLVRHLRDVDELVQVATETLRTSLRSAGAG